MPSKTRSSKPLKVINAHLRPGASHLIEMVGVWRTVEGIAGFGAGLGSMSTIRVWAFLMLNRDPTTGVVDIERDDLAKFANVSAERVSRILTALTNAGMIRRERERILGKQGPGKLVISIP